MNRETDRIREFVDKGNYHTAINIAISALNECQRNNHQAGVNKCIVGTMTEEFGSKS